MMRAANVLLVGGVAVLLAGCPEVREAQPGDLPGGREIVGSWEAPAADGLPLQRLHFLGEGRFLVDEGADGTLENVGRWTVEDDRLIVAYWEWSEICPLVPGAYRFAVQGEELTLSSILDECQERRASWERNLSRTAPPEATD